MSNLHEKAWVDSFWQENGKYYALLFTVEDDGQLTLEADTEDELSEKIRQVVWS